MNLTGLGKSYLKRNPIFQTGLADSILLLLFLQCFFTLPVVKYTEGTWKRSIRISEFFLTFSFALTLEMRKDNPFMFNIV